MNHPTVIDTYLATQPDDVRQALEHLRQLIKSLAPEAEEAINYGIPAFMLNGMLVGIAASKSHCGFYPGNGSIVEQYKDELTGYSTSKGTIRFTPDKPLPDDLVKHIVVQRIAENAAKGKKPKKNAE